MYHFPYGILCHIHSDCSHPVFIIALFEAIFFVLIYVSNFILLDLLLSYPIRKKRRCERWRECQNRMFIEIHISWCRNHSFETDDDDDDGIDDHDDDNDSYQIFCSWKHTKRQTKRYEDHNVDEETDGAIGPYSSSLKVVEHKHISSGSVHIYIQMRAVTVRLLMIQCWEHFQNCQTLRKEKKLCRVKSLLVPHILSAYTRACTLPLSYFQFHPSHMHPPSQINCKWNLNPPYFLTFLSFLPLSLLSRSLSSFHARRHLPSTRFPTSTRCQNDSDEKEAADSKKVRKREPQLFLSGRSFTFRCCHIFSLLPLIDLRNI